jgi:TolB-like protein
VTATRSPRHDFRVLTRRRGGYDGAVMVDVQLQVAHTGALVWAQTFSDDAQADEFQRQLEEDLEALDDVAFRRKYSVPSSA